LFLCFVKFFNTFPNEVGVLILLNREMADGHRVVGEPGMERNHGMGKPRNPVGAFLLLASGLVAGAPAGAAELPATVARVKESVVAVGTFQRTAKPPARFLGTGFAVRKGRHVLTNFHVLPQDGDEKGQGELAVFSRHGQRIRTRKAKVVAREPRFDLALLRTRGQALPPLTLNSEEEVREGERLAFTGFPIGMVLGLHPVTHRGIVSAVTPVATPVSNARQLEPQMIERLKEPYVVYQLDATAYPGNSGSPLYTADNGGVVGIINKVFVKETKESILRKPSGITYAIPISRAVPLLEEAGSE
jgi:S1-C subfamily serine protease